MRSAIRCNKNHKTTVLSGGEMKELILKVNGAEIKTNEFVTKIITNILTGVLESLKLDETPKDVVFTLSEKS